MKEGFQRMSKGTNPAVSTRRTGGTLEEIDQLFFWLYLLYAKSKYRQTDSYIDILGLSRILLSVPCCWDTRADVILKICLISPCAARSSCMPIILNLIPIHCSYPSRRLPPKSVLVDCLDISGSTIDGVIVRLVVLELRIFAEDGQLDRRQGLGVALAS
jgi:hypothetical protein